MATVLSQETSTTVAPRTWIPSHPPPTGPVRILALDGAAGGALRGYAQIKIVRSLMQAIWRKNNPGRPLDEKAVNDMRPCDHFVSPVKLVYNTNSKTKLPFLKRT